MTLFESLAIVLTLLLLEAVLSFDNAAILAAMVRRLPRADRRKALLYGLVGAYILRVGAIFLAAWLIRTPILKIIGGAYLLFLSLKHFVKVVRHRDQHHAVSLEGGWLRRLGFSALAATIIQIELVDLAFAIDQVIVAVAFTDEIYLIIAAALLGILFLRLAAAALARVMDWLPLLEHMAYVAVGYVGIKLMLLHPWFVRGATVQGTHVEGGTCAVPFIPVQHSVPVGGAPGCEIPTAISIAITLALFAFPVLVKLVFGVPRSTPGAHEQMARAGQPMAVHGQDGAPPGGSTGGDPEEGGPDQGADVQGDGHGADPPDDGRRGQDERR